MKHYFQKNQKLVLFTSAVVVMCGISVFAYAMQRGGDVFVKLKIQQLANLITANQQLVTIRPLIDDVPVCSPGALPGAKGVVYVSALDKVRVYVVRTDGILLDGLKLNEPVFFSNGNYRIEAKVLDSTVVLDPQNVKEFVVNVTCDTSSATNTNITSVVSNDPALLSSSTNIQTTPSLASTTQAGTSGTSTTGSPGPIASSSIDAFTSTTSANALAPQTNTQPTDTVFSIQKTYPQNWNIIPSIYKDNVRIFDVTGRVSVRVELPGDKVYLLLGNRSEWFADGIIDSTRGLIHVTGTHRYIYDFDSSQYRDGEYRVGAVYFDSYKGWVYTGTVDFTISNALPKPIDTSVSVPAVIATQTVVTTPIVASSSVAATSTPLVKQNVEYAPTWTQTSDTSFVPTLRLVVNDRAITALGHIFDREELEIRATTHPALSVQFFAYSLDGAFSPAIKEVGRGGKDDILSRDGKEVWAYTVDMGTFPAGNYRLFARIKTLDGKIQETQPASIVVQHLSQIPGVVEQKDETPLVVSEATREDILKRIHDPSACQNRQECQVFCSSSVSASTKCVEFTRVKGIDGLFDAVETQVRKLQSEAQLLSSPLPTHVASSSSVFPVFSGRPSIVDVLPQTILAEAVSKRSDQNFTLPEEVNSAVKLQHYCGAIENEKECTSLAFAHAPELSPVIEKQAELVRESEMKLTSILEQRSGARVYVDSDGDSVSDFDEVNLYHSDPTKKDTNGDGYSDGAAILGQTSVLSAGEAFEDEQGKIVLGRGVSVENPKIAGTTQSAKFAITTIAPYEVTKNDNGVSEIQKIVFKGRALPNSFIKVFLFSEPVVVTVKADDMGNWTYILDKTLPDGTHTAYVALADGAGRVLAKSEPLPFVKEASAITVAGEQVLKTDAAFEKRFMGMSPVTVMALLVGVLGLALSVVGIVAGMRHKHGRESIEDHHTPYGAS